ncbi:MAG TPA: hypothetical protein VKB88_13445 [Bryobacteraceae bacterium]|nr:hypothetical protein [Bryobacteraceae bacterium]
MPFEPIARIHAVGPTAAGMQGAKTLQAQVVGDGERADGAARMAAATGLGGVAAGLAAG